MEGFIIGGVVLAAILFLRSQDHETGTGAYAPVRVDTDDSTTDTICGSRFLMDESSYSASDDDWPIISATDGSTISFGYESDTSMEASRWTDPTYAYEPDNIYHNTPVDPTYHDDDWSSSTSSFDDSFSSSSSDDSWSGSSSTDSLSSCSSFDD